MNCPPICSCRGVTDGETESQEPPECGLCLISGVRPCSQVPSGPGEGASFSVVNETSCQGPAALGQGGSLHWFLYDRNKAWSQVGAGHSQKREVLPEIPAPSGTALLLPPPPSLSPLPCFLSTPLLWLPLSLSPTNLYSVSVSQKEKVSRRTHCLKAKQLF